MRIGKLVAVLVALITTCAIGFMLFLAATAIPQMLGRFGHDQGPQLYRHLASSMRGLSVFWVLLLIFYLLHLFRNPLLKRDARVSWVLAFLILGPLAELVYWWRYIWTHTSAATLVASD